MRSTTLPRDDVLQLGADERPALARLDVLELDDAPELPIDAEDDAVLDVCGRCHALGFPFLESGAAHIRMDWWADSRFYGMSAASCRTALAYPRHLADHTHRGHVVQVGMMAELLAGVHVGDVHLGERQGDARERIAQRHRGA